MVTTTRLRQRPFIFASAGAIMDDLEGQSYKLPSQMCLSLSASHIPAPARTKDVSGKPSTLRKGHLNPEGHEATGNLHAYRNDAVY